MPALKAKQIMVTSLVIVSSLFSANVAFGKPAHHKKWQSALTPEGVKGSEMLLAEKGKAFYDILIPAKPSRFELKAAEDLRKWFNQITGAEFKIVRESANVPSKFISVGKTAQLAKTSFASSKVDLKKEGYAIGQKDDNLFIIGGRDRGIINGIYSFLEEDLDCRWYYLDSASIPNRPTLKVTPILRTFVPVLEVRDPYYWSAFELDWALRNKTNSAGRPIPWAGIGYAAGYFVHTYNNMVPKEKYFKAHPEYFGEIDGKRQPLQLCLSNPDVIRLSIEAVKKTLRQYPTSGFISVSPNDGVGYCECKKCRALDEAEGTYCASLLKFVNTIADAIADEFPDVKVTTLAYLGTIVPPKTIRPRENVIIRVCTDRHAWGQPFLFVTDTQEFQTAMKDWQRIGAKMHVWDYTANYSHYALQFPNMPVVSENIRWMVDHNAKGIMLQGQCQGPGASRGPLRCWVWAKQLWNPKLDTRKLMRDFTYGYFGEAADYMQQYNDLLWKMWEDNYDGKIIPETGGIRFPPTMRFFTKEFTARATEIFKAAEKSTKDPEILSRVRLEKFALLYLKLSWGADFVKGDNFDAMLKEFEDIAKEHKITWLYEQWPLVGNHVNEKIAFWKKVQKARDSRMAIIPIGPECSFNPDPKNIGIQEQWFDPQMSDLGWGKIKCGVDGGWDTQGFKDLIGAGWYRIRFNVPPKLGKDKVIRIYVGAADEEADIWLNGHKVFEHTCASTGLEPIEIYAKPFQFDPGKYLKRGQENLLVLRVRNRKGMGGLWKPLFLITADGELSDEVILEAKKTLLK